MKCLVTLIAKNQCPLHVSPSFSCSAKEYGESISICYRHRGIFSIGEVIKHIARSIDPRMGLMNLYRVQCYFDGKNSDVRQG